MKKHLFLSIVILAMVWLNCEAQAVDFNVGYGTGKMLYIDAGYITTTNVLLKGYFGGELPTGTEGGNYTSTINWDQFPEDHSSEGSYYHLFGVGIGYKAGKIMFNGKVGYALETLYRNCIDEFHILGDNGKYYITAKGDGRKIDAGAEVHYLVPLKMGGIELSVGFSTVQMLIFGLGYYFDL